MSPWVLVALLLTSALAAPLLFYAALPWLAQPMLRAALSVRYRFKVIGLENVPREGPLLLTSNHLSWLDGFFVAALTPRRGKAMVSSGVVSRPVLKSIAVRAGMIPTPFAGPRAIRDAIHAAGEALDRGEALAVFPEGQITRTGLLSPFQRGIELILRGREHVAVVPVALDNVWGSVFSHSDGRFFRKRPQGWRRTVVIAYGPPVPAPVTAFSVRQGVLATLVAARRETGTPSHPLETLDPALPRWAHPRLGLLAASTAGYDDGVVRQTGHKPGTAGAAVPGVALRAVDAAGNPLPPDAPGRLEALLPDRPGWLDTGARGRIDRDGFVTLDGAP